MYLLTDCKETKGQGGLGGENGEKHQSTLPPPWRHEHLFKPPEIFRLHSENQIQATAVEEAEAWGSLGFHP